MKLCKTEFFQPSIEKVWFEVYHQAQRWSPTTRDVSDRTNMWWFGSICDAKFILKVCLHANVILASLIITQLAFLNLIFSPLLMSECGQMITTQRVNLAFCTGLPTETFQSCARSGTCTISGSDKPRGTLRSGGSSSLARDESPR